MTRSDDIKRLKESYGFEHSDIHNAYAELMGDYLEVLEENKNLKKQLDMYNSEIKTGKIVRIDELINKRYA